MDRINEAVQLFEDGYVCSQAVFAAFSPEFGISKEDALKIGACFGSGMRKAEVCGACTGALMGRCSGTLCACERTCDGKSKGS